MIILINRHVQRIMQSLDSATANKSLLVIAHRLSTIINSDKIVVIDGGKVVEEGNHQELLDLNGKYATMWETQTKLQDTTKKNRQEEVSLPASDTLFQKLL